MVTVPWLVALPVPPARSRVPGPCGHASCLTAVPHPDHAPQPHGAPNHSARRVAALHVANACATRLKRTSERADCRAMVRASAGPDDAPGPGYAELIRAVCHAIGVGAAGQVASRPTAVAARTQWAILDSVGAAPGLIATQAAGRTCHRLPADLRAGATQSSAVRNPDGVRNRGAGAGITPLATVARAHAGMAQCGIRHALPGLARLAGGAIGHARPVRLAALPNRTGVIRRTSPA